MKGRGKCACNSVRFRLKSELDIKCVSRTKYRTTKNRVVIDMAVEEIKKVAQLEQEMKQRKEAAVAEGKQRVLEAQRLARRQLEESRQEAELQVRQMMAKAEAEAAQWTLHALKDATQECEEFKTKARGRLDQAAAFIVEKVVNS